MNAEASEDLSDEEQQIKSTYSLKPKRPMTRDQSKESSIIRERATSTRNNIDEPIFQTFSAGSRTPMHHNIQMYTKETTQNQETTGFKGSHQEIEDINSQL